MPSKFMNGVAAKRCVIFCKHQNETPFDVLEKVEQNVKRENG